MKLMDNHLARRYIIGDWTAVNIIAWVWIAVAFLAVASALGLMVAEAFKP